jgi:hypothetical protein
VKGKRKIEERYGRSCSQGCFIRSNSAIFLSTGNPSNSPADTSLPMKRRIKVVSDRHISSKAGENQGQKAQSATLSSPSYVHNTIIHLYKQTICHAISHRRGVPRTPARFHCIPNIPNAFHCIIYSICFHHLIPTQQKRRQQSPTQGSLPSRARCHR